MRAGLSSVFLAMVLFASTVTAKEQVHAPQPRKLLDAKTVYLDKQRSLQVLADKAYDELTKWGRSKLVDEPGKAAIIMRLTPGAESALITGGCYSGGFVHLRILDPADGRTLWSDSPCRRA